MPPGLRTVFLSSTGRDLQTHREAVYRAIEGLEGWHCVRMEDFGAHDAVPLETCLAKVRDCDLFVGLIGHYYGSCPPSSNDGKSFTEYEYEEAARLRKPRLIFIASDEFLIPAKLRENENSYRRQQIFRKWVATDRVAAFFETPEPLATRVIAAIANWALSSARGAKQKYFPVAPSPEMHYRAQQAQRFANQSWTKRVLALRGRTQTGETVEARQFLWRWSRGHGNRILFLAGDPGSGKTGLAQWLAAELAADATAPVPIFVPLRRGRQLFPSSVADLRTLADPSPPLAVLTEHHYGAVFILDGLDELVEPTDKNHKLYLEVLSALLKLSHPDDRILVTCRKMIYEPISLELGRVTSAIFENDEAAITELAIQLALGSEPLKPDTLTLCELSWEEVANFLRESEAGWVWSQTSFSERDKELFRVPFTLQLLRQALPKLAHKQRNIDLDVLYETAIKAWLARETCFSHENLEKLLIELEDFTQPFVQKRMNMNTDYVKLFISAGIIHLTGGTLIEFSHHTFHEYFTARSIFKEMVSYQASLLHRMDLISAYNINRFLVPMLLRLFTRDVGAGCAQDQASTKIRHLSPVTRSRFSQFAQETGWRRGIGYGVHPFSDHATPAPMFSTEADFRIEVPATPLGGSVSDPVTRISWYDAFQYCRWSRTRPPMRCEFSVVEVPARGASHWSWAWDWHDESRAYIALLPIGGDEQKITRSAGANPDYRSSLIGLYVLD